MKVFYRSSFVNVELVANVDFRTVPSYACIVIEQEKNEPRYELLYNGVSVDATITSFACEAETELIVRQEGKVYSYSVKPSVRILSNKYNGAYEQFAYEYANKPSDVIESIQYGDLKLYAVEQSTEVRDLTVIFDQMDEAYKSIKYICEKPKAHLKAVNEVRPIDTVKRVGHESIPYLASHSEDWLARTASGLKPARLFSRVEDDEYQIYENRVTKTLIDLCVDFLRKTYKELDDSLKQLSGIMNSSVQTKSFGFDISFQKAVSELVKFDAKSNQERLSAFERITTLCDTAQSLLKKYRALRAMRLYRYLKKAKAATNPLNETNILLLDKHYNAVFRLWKPLHKEIALRTLVEGKKANETHAFSDYLLFCKTLCGYAAHVLNFELGKEGVYYRKSDELSLTIADADGLISVVLKDWSRRFVDLVGGVEAPMVHGGAYGKFSVEGRRLFWDNDVTAEEIEAFCALFKTRGSRGKEQADEKRRYTDLKSLIEQRQRAYGASKSHTFVIMPLAIELENDTRNTFKQWIENTADFVAKKTNADYVVTALPLCNENEQKLVSYAKKSEEKLVICPLTMFDINSFRRLQNILLRQIVAMDTGHCPSCGEKMRESNGVKICDQCRKLTLVKTVCPHSECRHEYHYISYDVSEDTIASMRDIEKQNADSDDFYQVDSLYQYKDIVKMTVADGKVRTVCPRCGR